MNNARLIGLGALLSMVAVACAAQTSPSDGTDGQQTGAQTGAPTPGSPTATPTATPTPAPAPAPAKPDAGPPSPPIPGCTPLAGPSGTANPAAVYCLDLGNTLTGEQCTFADGTSCEQWSFYRGECGQAHSFCNLHGGAVANKTENMGTWTASYALCTLPGGKQCQDDTFAHTCSCE